MEFESGSDQNDGSSCSIVRSPLNNKRTIILATISVKFHNHQRKRKQQHQQHQQQQQQLLSQPSAIESTKLALIVLVTNATPTPTTN